MHTRSSGLVDLQAIARDLDRTFEFAFVQEVAPVHLGMANSGSFINGIPQIFFEPRSDTFLSARLQYLIAT